MSEKQTTTKGLGRAVAIGAIWMLLVKVAIRFLALISMVILARLLSPEDFGVVAIAMSFFSLVAMFGEFGFDAVLIQKKEAGDSQYNTAWTINLIFSTVAMIVFCGIAPFVAASFDDPRIEGIMYAAACMFMIAGAQNIGVVNFRKHLEFRKEFIFATIPRFVGFAATIPIAFLTHSYWALIIGSIVLRASSTVLSYVLHDHRPHFTLSAWHELFDFSRWLIIRNLLQFVVLRSPELVAGKLLGAHTTGLVSVAREIPTYAVSDVVATINRATYPGYSKISDEIERLKSLYVKVLGSVALYVVPAGFGLAALADPIVPVVLGDQWLACIPLIQLLGLASMITALNTNTFYVLLALGNPRIATIVSAITATFLLPTLWFAASHGGTLGIALAILAASFVTAAQLRFIMYRYFRLSNRDLLAVYKRPFAGTAAMLSALFALSETLFAVQTSAPLAYLLIMAGSGAAIYALTVFILWLIGGRPDGLEAKIAAQIAAYQAKLLKRFQAG